jgi:antitoxin (DNA-binding transcriptional repressor) of toxin-antitoxin stability system
MWFLRLCPRKRGEGMSIQFEFWHNAQMTTITLDKAQQDLARLVKRALDGEEIVIETAGSDGRFAVRLEPVPPTQHRPEQPGSSLRGRGALKGQLVVGPEFFEPLSDEECGLVDSRSAS